MNLRPLIRLSASDSAGPLGSPSRDDSGRLLLEALFLFVHPQTVETSNQRAKADTLDLMASPYSGGDDVADFATDHPADCHLVVICRLASARTRTRRVGQF